MVEAMSDTISDSMGEAFQESLDHFIMQLTQA